MARLQSDYALITDLDCWKHPAWSAFTDAMDGREYGEGPLNAAWAFFKAGWNARLKHDLRPVAGRRKR